MFLHLRGLATGAESFRSFLPLFFVFTFSMARWKSAFDPTDEEVEMWYQGGVSGVCEEFPPFDLRPEVPTTDFGRTSFPSDVSQWGVRQLEVLRAIPLDNLSFHRVISARFLPKSPDLGELGVAPRPFLPSLISSTAFSQLRREIKLLFSEVPPAVNHFNALRLAFNEVSEKGWAGGSASDMAARRFWLDSSQPSTTRGTPCSQSTIGSVTCKLHFSPREGAAHRTLLSSGRSFQRFVGRWEALRPSSRRIRIVTSS